MPSLVPTAPALAVRYDVVIVGGGHNGLTAAAYLAKAGKSVLLLEALDHVGGAAISAQAFPGVDARLSRYSYLVSLLPRQIVTELGLPLRLRRRRFSSYTPVGSQGLLVDSVDTDATRDSFQAVTGSDHDHDAWTRFYAHCAHLAERIFPTVTAPLSSREELRSVVDPEAWNLVVERPLGETLRAWFTDDVVRGIVLTDGLIGTFADADEPSLRQNRCLLYHVMGGGTGDWDVPVGGMGAVTGGLADVALRAGAQMRTRARVTAVDAGGAHASVAFVDDTGAEREVQAGHVLFGCAPATASRLLGSAVDQRETSEPTPEGAQLKVNMLLRRLPRLRDQAVDPAAAFSGTFHVNESLEQLQTAYRQAAAGAVPELPPAEIYCHSLSDDTILGPDLRATGVHTLTLFGLHMPARLFRADNDGAREQALRATLTSLNAVLAEPIEDCLLRGPDGSLCLEARTPVDIEADVGLPGGNIFQRELAWPFAESAEDVGRWGVETDHPRVLLCGSGARRGGGVSGIPGRAAAMAVLDATS